MALPEPIKPFCTELSPPDVQRAIKFNEVALAESKISYAMHLNQTKLARQVFLRGYDAMYAAAALFLAKKFNIKLYERAGSTHRNMITVLSYLTEENAQHEKLITLYNIAIDKFQSLSEQYFTEKYFAKRVVKDLMSEGYNKGKKTNYYNEDLGERKDPLSLTIEDAKNFLDTVVEPFLYIMEELTQ